MTPIEQAKALAAYWHREALDLEGFYEDPYVAKCRETADLLERLAAELERP